MAKEKESKTNAMRILDRNRIPHRINIYECEEFIDGVTVANRLHQSCDQSFKTLVAAGKSGGHFVFVIPVAEELDLKKAARAAGEKAVELIPVREINGITGYIRGGCSPIGMKKQYPTFLHETALLFDEIIISGGRIGAQIFLSPSDLQKVTGAVITDLCRDGN